MALGFKACPECVLGLRVCGVYSGGVNAPLDALIESGLEVTA